MLSYSRPTISPDHTARRHWPRPASQSEPTFHANPTLFHTASPVDSDTHHIKASSMAALQPGLAFRWSRWLRRLVKTSPVALARHIYAAHGFSEGTLKGAADRHRGEIPSIMQGSLPIEHPLRLWRLASAAMHVLTHEPTQLRHVLEKYQPWTAVEVDRPP